MTEPARAELLEGICRIARAAGAATMPYFEDASTHDARTKDDRSQVTAADLAADRIILDQLAVLTPDIPIVTEEQVHEGNIPDIGGGRFWLVDPLDGTKEFLKAIPEFTVNIGLIEDGVPTMGVVYAPASGQLYAGVVGGSVFMEAPDMPRRPIKVRQFPADGITVALSRTYGSGVNLSHFLAHYKVAEQIQAGSSIKFCLIARGDADVYPRYGGTMEWDTAAAHAVLRAAGGRVREIDDGPELTYGKKDFRNPNFIAWGGEG